MNKVAELKRWYSNQKMTDILKDWKCKRYSDSKKRGWIFPALAEMRAEWEKRYGKWEWDNDLNEWQ